MNIILGGTGHIGSALSTTLAENNIPVTIVSRYPKKAAALRSKYISLAEVDIHNTAALHKLFQNGERLFLLNPPASPSTDTVTQERMTLYSILQALKGTDIKHVVAASTYGARPGNGQGDLNVLYEMEQELLKMNMSVNIIRSAYYMSNWDGYLDGITSDGILSSFYPADFALPMVAPADIGKLAAELMMSTGSTRSGKLFHLEGPKLYTVNDVAEAFSTSLGISVHVTVIPENKWKEVFQSLGFSDEAASSYSVMTKITLEEDHKKLRGQIRGKTSIKEYIRSLVKNKVTPLSATKEK